MILRLIIFIKTVTIGAFLILDALFLKLLSFDYSRLGLGFLDPFMTHLYWGIGLVFVGVIALLLPMGRPIR